MSTVIARPKHSPLGASGAERWMQCPGSVALLKTLTLPESDEPDYRTLGTSAHAAAADCLAKERDAWEVVGEKFEAHEVDVEMADAIQVYLDTVRPFFKECVPDRQCFIEFPISSPRHELFYGTVDAAVIVRGQDYHGQENLVLLDYKHGEGIAVDVEHNPQLMYYAFGFLEEYTEIDKVKLFIVQPRAFHPDGQVREWNTTAAEIRKWAEEVLFPAMDRTQLDAHLDAGPWCRFCPAKLVCPMLTHLFKAACVANPKTLVNITDESLGRSYQYREGVKFYLKALEDEVFRRLNAGGAVPGTKLVLKKANRVYRTDATALAVKEFGDEAMTKPELKSPAELEKLGPAAKAFVKEHAYKPQGGLTVALEDDKRVAVKVQSSTEAFAPALAKLQTAQETILEPVINKTLEILERRGLIPQDELDIPAFLKREKV